MSRRIRGPCGSTMGVVLGAAAVGVLALMAACGRSNLSPGPALVGTWKTAFPVTFYYRSDFCGNGPEDIGQANWNVTLTITAGSPTDPSLVNVEMTGDVGSFQPGHSSCGEFGFVPMVFPVGMQGTINGTAFQFGSTSDSLGITGSFTSDLMMGTYGHWECLLYCWGEYTQPNTLKFVRQ